jgi:outer membrane receptor protein involved in Fe transport
MDTDHCRRAFMSLLLVCTVAQAQAAPNIQSRLVYDAAFYVQFKPSTALDLIRETPGFTLIDTNSRRGFAGASGNVLVDGERPIAKSQMLSDILQRIPAKQVLRIELLRGGEGGADASGYAVVANVVRTPSAGAGVYQLGAEYAGRTPVPNGWASWSGRLGRTDYGVGANGYSLMRNLPGERVLLNGTGALVGTREDRSPRSFYQIAFNAEASRPMLGGQVRATGQVKFERYHHDSTTATRSLSGALTDFERDPYGYRKRTLESGIEYERPLGAWDLALSGLAIRTHFASDTSATHSTPSGGVDSIFSQAQVQNSGESIIRATLARALGEHHRFEAGAEAALNTLDQRLALTLDLGAGPFPIPIPNANLSITERRGEAYLADMWTMGRWTLESRLTGEASRLSFTGDTDQSVRLAYLKPSVQLTRKLGKNDQLRARLYRDVGQLDFTDFVSAASLADKRINGGNPDLKPETSWRLELAGDFRFAGDGALDLTVFHWWVADTADLIPVGPPDARIDAPGNIGGASVDGVQLTLRLPLKAFLKGASLNVDGTWQRSQVTDPLTGERRGISGFSDRALKAEFRQDLSAHKLAWGATYTDQPTLTYYRLAEIERTRASPSLDAWVETTALRGLKMRLTLLSLHGQAQRRKRTFFAPDRNGAVTGIEGSKWHPGRWLNFTVSGNF